MQLPLQLKQACSHESVANYVALDEFTKPEISYHTFKNE